MAASILNLLVIGMFFLPGFVLVCRAKPLTAGTVMSLLVWNLGFFLILGLLLQAFPSLIDPRAGL